MFSNKPPTQSCIQLCNTRCWSPIMLDSFCRLVKKKKRCPGILMTISFFFSDLFQINPSLSLLYLACFSPYQSLIHTQKNKQKNYTYIFSHLHIKHTLTGMRSPSRPPFCSLRMFFSHVCSSTDDSTALQLVCLCSLLSYCVFASCLWDKLLHSFFTSSLSV